MKKTISVNIGGFIFHIEEDAHDILLAYLADVQSRLDSEDSHEIMVDIEARIAELFQQKITSSKEVVTLEDVNEVMDVMGTPDAYGEESNTKNKNDDAEYVEAEEVGDDYTYESDSGKKRIYRDPEDQKIAGVCSGLAHYFEVDPTWIRLGFVLAFFTFGFSIPVYIVLWLVLPEAHSTTERMKMKGQKINSETIKEHFHNFKSKAKAKNEENKKKIVSAGTQIGEVLIKIVSFGMILTGFLLCIILGYWLFNHDFIINISNTGVNGFQMSDLIDVTFNNTEILFLDLGIAFVLGAVILGMFTLALKGLFGIKRSIKIPLIASGCIWGVGVFILIAFGVNYGRDNASRSDVIENIVVGDSTQSLKLTVANDPHFSNDFKDPHSYFFELIKKEEGKIIMGWPKVRIEESSSNSYEVTIKKECNGRTQTMSLENADKIEFDIRLEDNELIIPPYFSVNEEDKFRDQDVLVYIGVPNGKTIEMDANMSRVLTLDRHNGRRVLDKYSGRTLIMRNKRFVEDVKREVLEEILD